MVPFTEPRARPAMHRLSRAAAWFFVSFFFCARKAPSKPPTTNVIDQDRSLFFRHGRGERRNRVPPPERLARAWKPGRETTKRELRGNSVHPVIRRAPPDGDYDALRAPTINRAVSRHRSAPLSPCNDRVDRYFRSPFVERRAREKKYANESIGESPT